MRERLRTRRCARRCYTDLLSIWDHPLPLTIRDEHVVDEDLNSVRDLLWVVEDSYWERERERSQIPESFKILNCGKFWKFREDVIFRCVCEWCVLCVWEEIVVWVWWCVRFVRAEFFILFLLVVAVRCFVFGRPLLFSIWTGHKATTQEQPTPKNSISILRCLIDVFLHVESDFFVVRTRSR